MTALPPSPFLTDSVAFLPSAADEAVASNNSPQAPGAAANLLTEIDRAWADDHRFKLDVRAFCEALEPPPLFLQFEKLS
jgi:hypothetical protein